MRKRRSSLTFNLSFLDVMSCGLGAAVLIFLILRHSIDSPNAVTNQLLVSEINLLEQEIKAGEENLARARNTISQLSSEQAIAQGLARQIQQNIDELNSLLESIKLDDSESVAQLKEKLATLTKKKQTLENNIPAGNKAYEYTGEGQRQYLTGLKLGGDNVLILVDASASMLDETLVNVIRRRNMSKPNKLLAPKWQRTLAIVRWVIANLPLSSDYQVLTFNADIQSMTGENITNWEEVSDQNSISTTMSKLTNVVPSKGTNLYTVLEAAMKLTPLPDNIFLITDGLPTQGKSSKQKSTISGTQRLRLFERAIKQLDRDIPVNTILLPLEGDPYAAAAFWQWAVNTQGSFMTPAKDWP